MMEEKFADDSNLSKERKDTSLSRPENYSKIYNYIISNNRHSYKDDSIDVPYFITLTTIVIMACPFCAISVTKS